VRKSDFFLQFVVFGLSASIVFLLAWRLYPEGILKRLKPKTEGPKVAASEVKTIKNDPPSHIFISSVDLDLPVAPAKIVESQWTLYDDKASWLVTSKAPGEGNVILFAHNRDNLFGALRKINIGDEIQITSGDKKFTYKVVDKHQVKPDDVQAVLSDENRLTLYTCDGSFDQKRLIVIAKAETTTKI